MFKIPDIGPGHNLPPGPIEFTNETLGALSDWLKENPVIETEDQSRAGKLLIDRASDALKSMETERRSLVDPLNARIGDINNNYRSPRLNLEAVSAELMTRIESFVRKETARREQETREAHARAIELERVAREAEQAEQEAKADAAQGIMDVDVGAAVTAADIAFDAVKKSRRVAARANRDMKVKIGGGYRRALSLRSKEELIITNVQEAVESLGLTDHIKEAILTSARAYRREFDELPNGIESTTELAL